MQEKNISGKNHDGAITSEEILGKDVLDSDGNLVGVVDKVFIDPVTLDFVGISVDKGFIRRGITIGKNYISKIAKHAVFLKIRVAYETKGMTVFDRDGKVVGVVTSIDLHGSKNKIKNLHVKEGFINSITKKELVIPYASIKEIGENIILKVRKKSLYKK